MPIISIIVAAAANDVIGYKGKIPWLIKNDLKHFKELTMNKYVIMGRKTFFSLDKKLTERKIIVMSKNENLLIPDCYISHSVQQTFEICKNEKEIFIAGGEKIYTEFIDKTQKIYLTRIHKNFKGDAFMPQINFNEWKLIEQYDYEKDDNNIAPYSFLTYTKIVC